MSDPVVIRDVTEADLPAVARLHLEAFPDSVLGRLGAEAVRRNYAWQLDGPHDLTALLALDGDGPDAPVLGYLFGGIFRGSTIGFVKRERWFLARQLLRHPGALAGRVGWRRVALGLRLLVRRPSAAPRPEEPERVPDRSFGVLAIAVSPAAQGRGVGRAIMAEARARAHVGDFTSMHLSVHPDNAAGVAFYRSLGWSEMPEADGQWVGRMRLDLVPREA